MLKYNVSGHITIMEIGRENVKEMFHFLYTKFLYNFEVKM